MAGPAATAGGETRHGTCVAHGGRGLLILGTSGRGKSGLALQLIAYGAKLVADDQTNLRRDGDRVIASSPAPLKGQIEARGLGILAAPTCDEADITLVADLDREETDRFPPFRQIVILGRSLDLVLQTQNDHFPAALWLYLAMGRKG